MGLNSGVTVFDSNVQAWSYIPEQNGGGSIKDFPPSGTAFYVGNSTSYIIDGGDAGPSDGNTGLSPQQRLSTLEAAYNKVVSGRGDVIYVLPGHSETSALATMSKNNFSIVGKSNALTNPAIVFSGSTGCTVSGNGIQISGIAFSGLSGATRILNCSGASVELYNNLFIQGTNGGTAAAVVVSGNCTIANNKFLATSDTVTSAIVFSGAPFGYIYNNEFRGTNTSSTWSSYIIDGTGVIAGVTIDINSNLFINPQASTPALAMATNASGTIANNYADNVTNGIRPYIIGSALGYNNAFSVTGQDDRAAINANKYNNTSVLQSYAGTGEANVLSIVDQNFPTNYTVYVDTSNMTQDGTIRLYKKLDSGSGEELAAEYGVSAAGGIKITAIYVGVTEYSFRVSYEATVAEGASRVVPVQVVRD